MVALPAYSLRATSIYHRFHEYHEHLDRLVSPVPVNRFAKYAVARTLPGIVVGLLYGLHMAVTGNSKLRYRHQVVAMLESGWGGKILEELKEAYALGRGVYDTSLELGLAESIAKEAEIVLMAIRNSHEKLLKDAVRPTPMRSLRDVEAGVPFQPDVDYRVLQWLQRTRE